MTDAHYAVRGSIVVVYRATKKTPITFWPTHQKYRGDIVKNMRTNICFLSLLVHRGSSLRRFAGTHLRRAAEGVRGVAKKRKAKEAERDYRNEKIQRAFNA